MHAPAGLCLTPSASCWARAPPVETPKSKQAWAELVKGLRVRGPASKGDPLPGRRPHAHDGRWRQVSLPPAAPVTCPKRSSDPVLNVAANLVDFIKSRPC